MSRRIPTDRPLSEEDRRYLLDRGKEELAAWLDSALKDREPSEPDDEDEDEDELEDWLDRMSRGELVAEARRRGLKTTGSAEELRKRLRDFEEAEDEEEA